MDDIQLMIQHNSITLYGVVQIVGFCSIKDGMAISL